LNVSDITDLRSCAINLLSRGGDILGWEMGPQDRPIDLIFSHANGFNGRTYASILAPLADRYRMLLIDQRGHGRSTLPADGTQPRASWDDLAADLQALLTALDAEDVVLAGHSMGGTVSTLAAAHLPQRVRGLVLLDPVIMPPAMILQSRAGVVPDSPLIQGALKRRSSFPSREAVIEAYTGRGAFRSWSAQMLADYVADGFRDGPGGQVELSCTSAWEASGFTAQGHDPWPAFDTLTLPIHILRAETASTCRIEGLEAKVLALSNRQMETSHFLPMERPDLVQAALAAMIG
jgi:pimeloyl-ACP methyl ester carboxylesterase